MKHHGIYVALFISMMLVGLSEAVTLDEATGGGNLTAEQLAEQDRLGQLSAIAEDRAGTIQTIVQTWQSFADSQGWDSYWAEEFTAILSGASDGQLLEILNAKTYRDVQAILQGRNTALAVEGIQGPMNLGDLTNDLVFTPVVPCRFFDTRFDTDGNIPPAGGNPGSVFSYDVHGTSLQLLHQGHTAGTGCTSPHGEPSAIAANFTVVPLGKGHIRVWPFFYPQPTVSFLNYNTPVNSNLANAGIVATCYSCGNDISVSTWYGTAHSIGDVTGYFYAADTVPGVDYINGVTNVNVTQDCSTWKTLTSLSVYAPSNGYVACDAVNETNFEATDTGYARGAWSSSSIGSPNVPYLVHYAPTQGGWVPWSAAWGFSTTGGVGTYYLRVNKCEDTESVTMHVQSAKCVYYPRSL